MSDDAPFSRPPATKATAAQLAEGRVKRLAYEDQRRRHTQAWHRRLAGLADEPESEPDAAPTASELQQGKPRPRARGKLHDSRQGSFEV